MDEYLDISSLTLGELESIIDVARAQNKRNKNSPDAKMRRMMVGILNLSVSSILGRVDLLPVTFENELAFKIIK